VTLIVSQLTDPADRRFPQMYNIYAQSLPPREQKKRAEIEALLARPDYLILAFEDIGQVVSFAIVQLSPTEPIALLEYMATDPQSRHGGIGGHVFREVMRRAGNRVIIVEVDSEREVEAEDVPLRIRRKTFYRRLGCRRLEGLGYILPLPGEGAPPLIDLLVYCDPTPDVIAADAVRRWLVAIYAEVYDKNRDDPRIDSMLSSLQACAIPVR
jgi:ribosomal protein S18 acetylase RimI-like enzyme